LNIFLPFFSCGKEKSRAERIRMLQVRAVQHSQRNTTESYILSFAHILFKMPGHKHDSSAGTQNQGNTLGDRSCVRQSKLYRMRESGNDIKSILGTPHLCWDTRQKQGAYEGQAVYDHTKENPYGMDSMHQQNGRRNMAPKATGAPFARGESYGSSGDYETTSGGYGSRSNNDYGDASYGTGGNSYGAPSYGASSYGNGRATDYDSDSGYGASSHKGAAKGTGGQSTAYRTGLGGEDYGSSQQSNQTSLGNYSQANRRSKQLQDLPPNPYARREHDENLREGSNSYNDDGARGYPLSKMGGDTQNPRLSQMREMKDQIDTSAYRGQRSGGSSSALSAYAGNSRGAASDRSTRPW
jgi:hypothetical protein